MSIVDVLTNPDAFFDRVGDDPSLTGPFAVVLVTALVGTAAVYPMIQQIQATMPAEAGAFASIVVITTLIGGLVGPFVVWVILTLLFHAISALVFDGTGEFRTNLALVGWGYLPGVIGAVFSAVGNAYLYRNVEFPSDPAAVQGYLTELQNQPEFTVISLVGVVILLWQGFLWTYAEKHARNLTLQEAAITVGVPVGLYTVWQLFTLL